MGKSICCQSETRLGYYNASQRPDIHGIITGNGVAISGTYCLKCEKLCDFTIGNDEFYTNGIKKSK